MNQKDLTQFTNQELEDELKKMKSFSITNAFMIGFLIGIIVYSVVKNNWGMLTLIPLYFIYKLINDPKNKRSQEIELLLKERTMK
jgi:hypothetical protein